jgi:hypothetical protein
LRQLFAKRWFVLVAWQLGSILLCGLNVFNALLASNNGRWVTENFSFSIAFDWSLEIVVHNGMFDLSQFSSIEVAWGNGE